MSRKKRNKRCIHVEMHYNIQDLATYITALNNRENIIHLFDEIHEQIKEDGMDYEDWERRLTDWAIGKLRYDFGLGVELFL